ncbi:MAG: alpha/beta fold hydrolase [Pseudomonadales bacterium]|nr:alpha/beta fold hydrolase [Pseudomonadales bacterium]
MSSLQSKALDFAPADAPNASLRLAWQSAFTAGKPSLLLLHGWGASSSIWGAVREQLALEFNLFMLDLPGHGVNTGEYCDSVEDFYRLFERDVAPLLPERFGVLGWSLGGMLGSLIAARNPCVNALVTVASNPLFIAQPGWPQAMPAADFEQFSAQLRSRGISALQRFVALQTRGAPSARADRRWLQRNAGQPTSLGAPLMSALQWLATTDLRDCYSRLAVPVCHHLGACDALVPVALGEELREHFPSHRVQSFAHSGHLPFVSESSLWCQSVIRDLYEV